MRNVALVLLSATALLGQSSGIQGVITDPTTAAVPDVKVSVTNIETGVTTTASTNEHGFYSVPFLQTGNYKISADKAGFSPIHRDNLKLNVDQIARVDFSLKIGA